MPADEGHVHWSGALTEEQSTLDQSLTFSAVQEPGDPIGTLRLSATGYVGPGLVLPNSTAQSPAWSTIPGTSPALEARQDGYYPVDYTRVRVAGPVGPVQAQIDALEAEIVVINAQIVSLQAADVALDVRLDVIEPAVAALQSTVSTHTTQIAALQTAQANAVLLDPTSAGIYNGNTFTPPPDGATEPWLRSSVIPYSAGDTHFDLERIRAQDEFGNTVNTNTKNGNGEGRRRPSSRTRVADKVYESAEAVGGSTDQYVQWSSDTTLPANREPFLGGWGSASPKPGWVEATRVLSALAGNSIGGTVNAALAPYNTLSAFIFRGLKTTAGAPAAGTWAVNDVILDSLGVVYRCTVAGTPGTWVGNVNGTPVAVAYTGLMGNAATISDGTSTGAPYALTTTLKTADNRVYFDGAMANNGGVPIVGGTVLCTVTAAHAPTAWVQCNERTSTLLSSRVTVRPDGTVRLDQAMAAGATISLDGFNYRKS